jgi:hypothetical protein
MHKTLVFSKLLAFSLNFLTDVAHVPVSTLGKIFKTNLLPTKSDRVVVDKSFLTNSKLGDFEFNFGNSPFVFIGFPHNVIVEIFFKF